MYDYDGETDSTLSYRWPGQTLSDRERNHEKVHFAHLRDCLVDRTYERRKEGGKAVVRVRSNGTAALATTVVGIVAIR